MERRIPLQVRGTMFDLDSHKRLGRKTVAVVPGALVTAGAPSSQAPTSKQDSTPDSGIVLRQTVRRVRVDVIVTDAQGHAVPHLQADDFRVSEDGKPQSIRQFERHGPENAEPAVPTRPTLPPHTFMNLLEAPGHGPLTVPASQLDLPVSANGDYHPRLSLAALAFNADGETLYGNSTRIEGAIRPCDIDKVRYNGYPVLQVFLVPVDTAVLRLVVRDEHNGRIGSMEFGCHCRRGSRRIQPVSIRQQMAHRISFIDALDSLRVNERRENIDQQKP